jgi:ABC-type multidrug transport system fused ATPase/permease subunit
MTTWQYMRRLFSWRRREFLLNCLAWLVFHLVPLANGLIVRAIFNALSGSAPAGLNAWTLLTILACSYAFRQSTFFVAFRLFSRYYLTLQAFLRRNLLEHLMMAAGSRVLPESPSEAVSRFRDDVDDVVNYAESWIDFSGFVLYGICSVAVLAWIDPAIAAIVCAPLFLMSLVMRRLSPIIRTYRRRMREATARVTDAIGEAFAAVQAIKVAGREDSMTAHFRSLGEERRRRALADVLLTEMIRGLNNGLVFIGTGLMLTMAAARIRSGEFSIGDLAIFMQLLPRLTNVLTFIGGDVFAQHRRVRVATERMEHLMVDAPQGQIVKHTPLDLTGPVPTFAPRAREGEWLETLRVRGLSYRYPNSEAGIGDVSFELRRGDFVVVTGRIGSGKTTLLRVLQGLAPRAAGEIEWNGRLVEDPATFFTPPHSSYTSQAPRLFSETLRDNVMLGAGGEEELERAMHLAAMGPDLATFEHGLDTLVGTRGVKLSGGQVQRASAARMFARGADLLIFDDLSSALDVATERQLWESLTGSRDATCLVVSHRRPALRRATKILLLSEGRLIAEGSLQNLLDTQPEMRRLWDAEAEEEEG